ncbi:MAG TPA: DUF2461 family protein [Candidatus Sulfotelmatobacter sp.]|nr:DUF2461 family protein [Candidatus Sulfotelmatobacter sp.]
MATAKPVFSKETFQFFRELGNNNRKAWMDENRERYKSAIVQPFRRLLEELATPVLKMNGQFDTSGRTGANFSRINRDIRFAKDKTPYKTQMYLKFSTPSSGDRENGQLYVGLSTETVTAGFRIYAGGRRKESALAEIAEPRVLANPQWIAQQKKRLGKKYESYWYTTEKGEWTKHESWPTQPENWKKIQAWIVRKKMKPGDAMRAGFTKDAAKVFQDVYPLLKFTSLAD